LAWVKQMRNQAIPSDINLTPGDNSMGVVPEPHVSDRVLAADSAKKSGQQFIEGGLWKGNEG